jgi:L-alanine-DL-glutamate epimerase-like enolase superfamily enzyme
MKIVQLDTSVYRIPTDYPEADGTLEWDSTTIVLVEATSDSGLHGLGYTYGASACATLINDMLVDVVLDRPVEDVRGAWEAMIRSVRNVGRPGIASHAISAVDTALWDLWACAQEKPLYEVLGAKREMVPIYGSGGFTSYSFDELDAQLSDWVRQGIPRVKIKIGKDGGTRLEEDIERVRIARQAIGLNAALFIDANGAYTAEQAIRQAAHFQIYDVSYFEEPVVFDLLEDLAQV